MASAMGVLVLLLVPTAQASTASFSGGTLTITAAPGEKNEDKAGITAGEGCKTVSAARVECGPHDPQSGHVDYGNFDAASVYLGDRDDKLAVYRSLLKTNAVDAGDGNDDVTVDGETNSVVVGGGEADRQQPGPAGPQQQVDPSGPPAAVANCWVPAVKNPKPARARQKIDAAGCKVKVKRDKHRRVKKGRAIRTAPGTGKVLAAGATVTIYVSKGKK